MNAVIKTLLLVSLSSLSGCASWPLSGKGGMAEHSKEILSQPLGPKDGLRFELDMAKRHLDILVLEGAELCFPATIVQAKQRQNRIAREINGALKYDAANDLIVQRKLLSRLEHQLDYVKQQDICVLPIIDGMKAPGDIGSHIHQLLNNNNQFIASTSELNPKYIIKLADAARTLRDLPSYKLKITGHASKGESEKNDKSLSLKRAKKVGRYLQILGLPHSRIQYDVVSATVTTSPKIVPHAGSMDHRISIELIETVRSRK